MQQGQWWLRGEVTLNDIRWRRLSLRCVALLDHAAWEGAFALWRSDSSRRVQAECLHGPEFLSRRVNQWASIETCDKKRGGCGAILDYTPTAAATASREAKAKAKAKAKAASSTIDQRAAQVIEGSPSEKDLCPRCGRGFFTAPVANGQIQRCLGWKLAGRPCLFIKAMPGERIIPGLTRGPAMTTSPSAPGNLATGFGGAASGRQTATDEQMRPAYGTAVSPAEWVQQQQQMQQQQLDPAVVQAWMQQQQQMQQQQHDPAMVQAQLVQLQVVQQQLLEQLHHQQAQDHQQAPEDQQQHHPQQHLPEWHVAESTGRMND